MATEGIIPGQSSINVRYFNLGKGAFDVKLAVVNLAELNSLIAEVGGFYDSGNLVWVMSERKHYIINIDGSGTVTAAEHDLGGSGGGSQIPNSGLMYYGGQQTVFDWEINSAAYAKPSVVGYKNGDMIVAADAITGFCTRFDVWEVEITTFSEGYLSRGSIKGDDGLKGDKGETGDKGEAFQVNGQGPYASMPDCTDSNVFDGFAYLATDQGLIYFAIKPTIGQCSWSSGAPFGKGDPGRSTYTVFRRSVPKLTSTDRPADDSVQEVVIAPPGNLWFDGVPPEDGNPGTNDVLYMSQATYAVIDSTVTPILTDPPTFSWTTPTQVEGADGLDGREGTDAGFWVVWSEGKDKPAIPTNKPVKDPVTGEDTWAPDGSQTWFDDIDYGNVDKDDPRWMAQINYNGANALWGTWVVTLIGGEKPPYKVNIFAREEAQPATPTLDVDYIQLDGTFTSGANAATLINASLPQAIWFDGPPPMPSPVPVPAPRLWMTEVFIEVIGPNSNWSPPVEIDGAEGDEAGVWTVWTDNAATDVNALPILETANDIINNELDTIDLTGSPQWYDTNDTADAVWMAQTYFRKGVWSAWRKMKVKGEKGDPGSSFTIDSQGNGAPTGTMYCDKPKGWSYLNLTSSLLYFKTTDIQADPCTGVGWSAGAPFGKGSNGANSYNLFAQGPVTPAPTAPGPNVRKDAAIGSLWKDAPPVIAVGSVNKLWMTTTNYAVNDDNTTSPVSFTWSTSVQIDGEEGVSAGIWSIWSSAATPPPPPPAGTVVSNDGSSINLSGAADWEDDVAQLPGPAIWMATSFYRPAQPTETGDANGWVWTVWTINKVKGEDGNTGVDGTPAYSYVPTTVFLKRLATDTVLPGSSPVGFCLTNTNNVYSINDTGGMLIGATQFSFTPDPTHPYRTLYDGIPNTTNDERVWMLSGVLNSNDHLCSNLYHWPTPSILKDTAGIDYKYHRGAGSPSSGQSGTKPADPSGSGTNPDTIGWYDDPDLVVGNAFWIAQKNWSEGPAAQWKVYQIRGEDGASSNVNVYYSTWYNYNPNSPEAVFNSVGVQNMLGTPDNKPAIWTPGRETDNHVYSDICASSTNSYFVAERMGTTPPPPAVPEDPARGLYNPFIADDWVISRIDVTALPLRNTINFSSSVELISTGNKLNKALSHTAGVIRLARPGDTEKVTGGAVDIVDGIDPGSTIRNVGFPSIFITNWVNHFTDETLLLKVHIQRFGNVDPNTVCNGGTNMIGNFMHDGKYAYPEPGRQIYTDTRAPWSPLLAGDPSQYFKIWKWTDNPQTANASIIEVDANGIVLGGGGLCP